MADIFVSYATEDHERVRPLVEALEANGFEVWWARNILGGEDFSAEIERQIHVASAVIVAWSKRAVASSWVRDEAVIARDANKLVPVRLDAVEAPLGFRQLQVIDLERWSGEPGAPALNQVLAAVQRTGGATSLAHQASIPRWSSMRRGMEKLRANKALTTASGLALAFALLAAWQSLDSGLPQQLVPAHLEIRMPPGVELPLDTEHPVLALSPDGTQLAFVGEKDGVRRLYTRRLEDPEAQPIVETKGAAAPFYSPDGAWIAFFVGNIVKKVSSSTGTPIDVHNATEIAVNRGAAWITDTTLVMAGSADQPLSRGSLVDGQVGTRNEWTRATESITPGAWPAALPGTNVLFTENAGGRASDASIAVLSLTTGKVRPLLQGGTSPRYSSTGHVLFTRGGELYAVHLDSSLGEVRGPERALSLRIVTESFGAAQYAVGGNGVLAYIPGESSSAVQEFVWVDRSGNAEPLLDTSRVFRDLRLSPDGTRLAVTGADGPNWDIWTLDLGRGTFNRVTSHPREDLNPVWSPDGRDLVIASEVEQGELGPRMALVRESSGQPELLVPASSKLQFPTSWSPDGRWIAYVTERENGFGDIMLFATDGSGTSVPFVETPNTTELGARFSPNGKWIAYISDETGARQIYVRSFPEPGRAITISTNGGVEPVWSKDGQELFYRNGDAFMVVALGDGPGLVPEAPRMLFNGRYEMPNWGGSNANYDVSSDGQRFLMIRRKTTPTANVIKIVLNWPAVLLEPQRVSKEI